MLSAFKAIDTELFYVINKGCSNPLFDILMPLITVLGSGDFIFAVSFLLLFLKKKEYRMAAIAILAGLTITYYAVSFLKGYTARPRPFIALQAVPPLESTGGFSFPSGHTAVAFLASTILSKFFKRYLIFIILASLVAFSRVYMGVHYVSDVIGGAVIGAVIGYGLVKLVRDQGR